MQQIHVKILYHLMPCSLLKEASRFKLSTEGFVYNPPCIVRPLIVASFFGTWQLGQRASVPALGPASAGS